MTVLTPDQTLEPIAPRSYPGDNPRERVIQRCLSDGARTYDWKTKTTTETELVHATSIPETADAFHANYLGYLQHGWTPIGFQVWCTRHNANVVHVDFEGVKHPANRTMTSFG